MNKRFLDAETRYPELEKLALALMVASRKLRPYFHAHSIEVLTNYLLRQVLQKSEALGMLLKWVIKLREFDVNFHPRMAIKGQVLADFIGEFTYADTVEVAGMANIAEAAKVVEAQGEKNSTLAKEDTEQWTPFGQRLQRYRIQHRHNVNQS